MTLKPTILCCVLVSTAAAVAAQPNWSTVSNQPKNVGDAAISARAYHASGAYAAGMKQVADDAISWISERAPKVVKPALVLDIDETALSNWAIIKRDDFGRPIAGGCDLALDAPCGWAAWDQLGRDPPVAPVLALFRAARNAKISVFFITGRPEAQRKATANNLTASGYDGYTELAMVPAGQTFKSAVEFKSPVRARIEREGYTIIANVGDQPSDLLGGHAERQFLLPDPFYRVP